MTYVKNTWASGDVITAAKLNNIEDALEEFSNIPVYDGAVADPEAVPQEVSDAEESK